MSSLEPNQEYLAHHIDSLLCMECVEILSTSKVSHETPYQELLAHHIDSLLCVRRVSRGYDADQAGVIVKAVEGRAVLHPAVLVEHTAVQPGVHALACKVTEHSQS